MRDIIIDLIKQTGIKPSPLVITGVIVAAILFISIIVHVILQFIFLNIVKRRHGKKAEFWSKMLLEYDLFSRISYTFQGMFFQYMTRIFLEQSFLQELLILFSNVWILIYGLLSIFALMNDVSDKLQNSKISAQLPVKGIFQSIKLLLIITGVILIISMLIGKSPALLFSSLGAMTAVLMLVFKDPLLGLVAGFQLTSNNMLKVGDWLDMPKYNADGAVLDISLTTVKVQNWDKTITTIPTYALISDSFKNWRGMSESGGRRIKRSIFIDTNSIHFLSDQEIASLNRINLIKDYLQTKIDEVNEYNRKHGTDSINSRKLTNVGTFRAYLNKYIENHPRIHKEMAAMVRQLAPTNDGLPIEVYAFANTTIWVEYENIQADLFDHIFAILPEFNLRLHQTPTGNDIKSALSSLKQ